MKIAVVFEGDNVLCTFNKVMETLEAMYIHYGELPQTKEELISTINTVSYQYYLDYQIEFRHDEELLEKAFNSQYLIFEEDMLLLNDEVDEYLKSLDIKGGNNSTFVLDTELFNNNVCIV